MKEGQTMVRICSNFIENATLQENIKTVYRWKALFYKQNREMN